MTAYPDPSSVADLSIALATLDPAGVERKAFALHFPRGQFSDISDAPTIARDIAAIEDDDFLMKFTSGISTAAHAYASAGDPTMANVYHRVLVLAGEEQDHRAREAAAGAEGQGGLL